MSVAHAMISMGMCSSLQAIQHRVPMLPQYQKDESGARTDNDPVVLRAC